MSRSANKFQDEAVKNTDVKSFAERIGRLEDEKQTLSEDIAAIYAEADESGLDKKALRQAIRVKRKETDLSHKMKVNTYLEALGELPLFATYN